MYVQTTEVGEPPVKNTSSQRSSFNIFFLNVRQDGYTKIKRSVCDLTHRIFTTRSFNLLRPKLRPLHSRLIIHRPVQKKNPFHITFLKRQREITHKENVQFIKTNLYQLFSLYSR